MNPESKNCQNCNKTFVIEVDDFSFYEKIGVPAPTFCPQCRLQRRLVWMKGLDLFKRKCDLCGEMKLSMYSPDAPYTVYCTKCWWSDNWSPGEYAMEYDPNRPFFDQWNELLHKVPLLGLSIDSFSNETSPYTNHVGHSKDSYLIYYSDYVEDSMCGFEFARAKNVYNSGTIMESEGCYDCSHVYKSYNIVGATGNNRSCYDCFFIRDCEGCHHCFGLSGGRNMSYVFLGEQLSKEEYEKRIKEINLGSYSEYNTWKDTVREYFKTVSPKPVWETLSTDVSGSYVFHSKNVHDSFDVIDCEDSKYLMLIKTGKVKDSYDYIDWGENSERLYECLTVGGNTNSVYFTHEAGHSLHNVEYSKLVGWGCSYLFGCIGFRKTSYCILNKQYSKEEYEKLRLQIIDDMNSNPYIAKEGHIYKYGEFFPMEFSPNAYNDSFASRFFPLTKEQVIEKGLHWYEPESREYSITMKSEDVPQKIQDVDGSILENIIQCSNCVRGYKIISQELQFLKKYTLPLPTTCPFCRVWEKIDIWVENMTLHDRTCGKCGVEFKTHYSTERAPKIFCKECYKQEYL